MAHPHKNVISEMKASNLIGILDESKLSFIREHITIHLHESELKLLKNVRKHQKHHHKKIRIKQYEKAEKNDLFNLHLDLYLKKYKKLEKKGLIVVDENPENGLPYDCNLTDKGQEVLTEICYLEDEWEKEIGLTEEDREVLKKLALDSFEISYKHKKKQGFIF